MGYFISSWKTIGKKEKAEEFYNKAITIDPNNAGSYYNLGKLYQDLKICIFDGSMGLGNSRILPSGPLRESLISGLKKTNIAIIIGEDKNNIQQTILKNREHVNVYNGVFVPDKNTIFTSSLLIIQS